MASHLAPIAAFAGLGIVLQGHPVFALIAGWLLAVAMKEWRRQRRARDLMRRVLLHRMRQRVRELTSRVITSP